MTHIYALVSGQLVLYVGKTIRTLKRRETQHRSKGNNTYSRYIPDYIDWTIKLLETVPNDQARIKEQYYYDTLKPLYNQYKPIWSSEEYKKSGCYNKAQRRYYLKKKSEAPVDETVIYQTINKG
jgi:hypothetical protein